MSEGESSCSAAPASPTQTRESRAAAESRPAQLRVDDLLNFLQAEERNKTFEDLEELGKELSSFLKRKNGPAESYEQREVWLKAETDLVEQYRKTCDCDEGSYKDFTESAREKCKEILSRENKTQPLLRQEPSSRTKEVDSVTEKMGKVRKQARKSKEKGSNKAPLTQLIDSIVDLAGVRILVYFPDDVSRVVKVFKENPDFEFLNTIVSYSRKRKDNSAKDKSDQS